MKRLRLLVAALVIVAACGGGSTTTPMPKDPGGEVAATGGTAVELWAPVMKPGAIFTMEDTYRPEDAEEPPSTVVATVTDVQEVEGGRVAFITWTQDGYEMSTTHMPTIIVVATTGVTFYSDPDAYAARDPEADTYPAAAAPAKLPGGLYIDPPNLAGGFEPGGELCYGWGPEEGDEDCEDTCFSQICVHPEHGITGGEGRWWPDYSQFVRKN